MVETLPPAKSPFDHLSEAERELDWQENRLRRHDGGRPELGLLAFLTAATALLAAVLWWWLTAEPVLVGPPASNRSE